MNEDIRTRSEMRKAKRAASQVATAIANQATHRAANAALIARNARLHGAVRRYEQMRPRWLVALIHWLNYRTWKAEIGNAEANPTAQN